MDRRIISSRILIELEDRVRTKVLYNMIGSTYWSLPLPGLFDCALVARSRIASETTLAATRQSIVEECITVRVHLAEVLLPPCVTTLALFLFKQWLAREYKRMVVHLVFTQGKVIVYHERVQVVFRACKNRASFRPFLDGCHGSNRRVQLENGG